MKNFYQSVNLSYQMKITSIFITQDEQISRNLSRQNQLIKKCTGRYQTISDVPLTLLIQRAYPKLVSPCSQLIFFRRLPACRQLTKKISISSNL